MSMPSQLTAWKQANFEICRTNAKGHKRLFWKNVLIHLEDVSGVVFSLHHLEPLVGL